MMRTLVKLLIPLVAASCSTVTANGGGAYGVTSAGRTAALGGRAATSFRRNVNGPGRLGRPQRKRPGSHCDPGR
jgi:hypothetical protein